MNFAQLFQSTYAGILIYPVLALAIALLLTRLCIKFLPKLGFVRQPGGRHIHTTSIPRGGGIAVIIAFFTASAAFLLGTDIPGGQEYFLRFLLPALPLIVVGLLDDRWEISAWIKLAVQFAVALIIWNQTRPQYTFFNWAVPWFVSLGVTAFWVILVINAFNLIDGLDGLATGLGIISCGCMAVWFIFLGNRAMEVVTIAIMAGALLGFLRYNFYPARIFLGDTGSTFIGLFFAILSLSTTDRVVTLTSILIPLLAIGVPIFDVFLAIWRRSARKLENNHAGGIMTGDKEHLHHRVLCTTQGQKATALRLYLIGCTFSVIAIILLLLRQYAPAVGYLILMIALLIVLRQFASIELWDSARLIRNGLSKPRMAICLHMAQPFYDFLAIALSFAIAANLSLGSCQDLRLFICCFAPPGPDPLPQQNLSGLLGARRPRQLLAARLDNLPRLLGLLHCSLVYLRRTADQHLPTDKPRIARCRPALHPSQPLPNLLRALLYPLRRRLPLQTAIFPVPATNQETHAPNSPLWRRQNLSLFCQSTLQLRL